MLAELSDSGMIDQLQQLEVQYALAKPLLNVKSVCGNSKLVQKCNTFKQRQFKSLQKSISQMQDQVAKTKISAPFDGIVDHILADEGIRLLLE